MDMASVHNTKTEGEAASAAAAEPSKEPTQEEKQSNSPFLDWKKVGKIYRPESAIEDIIAQEVGRMNKALDINLDSQLVDLEEKLKKKK